MPVLNRSLIASAWRHKRHLATASAVLLAGTLLAPAVPAQTRPKPQVIAYVFPNLPGDRLLTPADINTASLTRINYAFAVLKNGNVVEDSPNDAANLAILHKLRAAQPGLQLVISIGGWLGSGGFSDAALTPESRGRFVESALAFVTHYDLDGVDIDWEYPGQSGADNRFRPEDGTNFNLLLRALRTRFDEHSRQTHKPLLLTIAAGASISYLEHTQTAEAQRYLDGVNLMAYDYYEAGSTPNLTGNHAALFADPKDPQKTSAALAVEAFEQAGVPASKLILGVPFYGHVWGHVAPTDHGLFQTGVAVPGVHAGYADVQGMLTHGFTRFWDEASQVPYAYNEATQQFVSYEDPQSLERKCAFVLDGKLGGVMFWQYLSDPSGTLLNTIHRSFTAPAPAAAEAGQ